MLNIFDSELSEQQFISMFTWCYNNLKIKKMGDKKKEIKGKLAFVQTTENWNYFFCEF